MSSSSTTDSRSTPIAYLHLLSVINTESARFTADRPIRVLDAGCGAGGLLLFLSESLAQLQPSLTYEFYGFDVTDRPSENFDDAVHALSQSSPGTPWAERLIRFSAEADWPYPADFFDVVVSNQVGEHLRDHGHFFRQIGSCLSPTGFSANLFPLKHVIMEWHILVPFAHRIRNYDLLRAFLYEVRTWRRRILRNQSSDEALDFHAQADAEYIVKYTGYISYSDLLTATKRAGLMASMRYTSEFYGQKLRRMLGRPPQYRYSRQRSILSDWLLVFALRYVNGVTVFLEKGQQ